MNPPPSAVLRPRLLARLRALMARTVANGCTEQEELAAARLVGTVAAQLDGGAAPEAIPAAPWAQVERNSAEYQAILRRTTAETLLKAAIQELALTHINTVSPPHRRAAGLPTERIGIHDLLAPHFGMMLNAAATRMGGQILGEVIDELVEDGALPPYLDLPVGG